MIRMLLTELFTGYKFIIILMVLFRWLRKSRAVLWDRLLYYSNGILLAVTCFYELVYTTRLFMAWYSQVTYEQEAFKWRVTGPYWYAYWIMILLNLLAPQLFWFRKLRKSYILSLLMLPLLSIGFIFEQMIMLWTSTYRDYLTSSWTYYAPRPLAIISPFFLFCLILAITYFLFESKKTDRGISADSRSNR